MRGSALLALVVLLSTAALGGAPVAVRHREGVVQGDRVTSRLVFHFKDGSLHDETAVFTQRQRFQLLRDRVVQKGPMFPHPIETTI